MYQDLYNKCLSLLKAKGRLRFLNYPNAPESPLNFASNDYLNLRFNPIIMQRMNDAATRYGNGATGARLFSGDSRAHHDLESLIAQDKKAPSALIMSSGFQCNVSTLAALLDPEVLGAEALVFFDRYNHASLYQGALSKKCDLKRYDHNDLMMLETLLDRYKNTNKPKFIVTQSLSSISGSILPLPSVLELAKKHNAFLYLDEAHSTGVLGPRGYGLSEDVELDYNKTIVMGTFSKGLGSYGSYIACSKTVKEYLINKSLGFIYSTALPPMVIAGAKTAWELVPQFNHERIKLMDFSQYLRKKLKEMGFDIGSSNSHIIPIILGKEEKVMTAQQFLREKGACVAAARPPTAPVNKACLRISLTLAHSTEHVDSLLSLLKQL